MAKEHKTFFKFIINLPKLSCVCVRYGSWQVVPSNLPMPLVFAGHFISTNEVEVHAEFLVHNISS
jgi:hypothetical protein